MAKATSKRTTQWRKDKEQQGFKQVSVYLHEQVIKQLELLQEREKLSRASIIAMAVEQLEHNRNTTETNNSIGTEREIINILKKQIEEKDQQIRDLISSQLQNNQLLAGFQKEMGFLEGPVEAHKEPIQQQNIKTEAKKKKKKSKKGKSKN
jgi:hypothetical protein